MKLFKRNKEPEMQEREDGLTDYNVYIMSRSERIFNIILAAIIIFAVGMIFYHNPILSAILALFSLRFPRMRTKQIIKTRKVMLNSQFKDYTVGNRVEHNPVTKLCKKSKTKWVI